MKKVNFKNVLMALSLVLTFLLVGANQSNAQTISGSSNSLYSIPTGSFVGIDQAKVLLQAKMGELKLSMVNSGSQPGQTAYDDLMREYQYYAGILNELNSGNSVPKSIVGALSLLVTDAYGAATPAQQATLKQAAVSLLTS